MPYPCSTGILRQTLGQSEREDEEEEEEDSDEEEEWVEEEEQEEEETEKEEETQVCCGSRLFIGDWYQTSKSLLIERRVLFCIFRPPTLGTALIR